MENSPVNPKDLPSWCGIVAARDPLAWLQSGGLNVKVVRDTCATLGEEQQDVKYIVTNYDGQQAVLFITHLPTRPDDREHDFVIYPMNYKTSNSFMQMIAERLAQSADAV